MKEIQSKCEHFYKKEIKEEKKEGRFDDCGFLKVKIDKRLNIADHGVWHTDRWGN